MFHTMPEMITERMQVLEALDAEDRRDGTPRSRRLRQITPDTGKLLSLLTASAPKGAVVELGTSAGYSTLWLILGVRGRNQRVITFEADPQKIRLAQETFQVAGVFDQVDLREGDARQGLISIEDIGFCFMDLDKSYYQACYELIVPRLVPGGLLVADNMLSHENELAPFLQHVQSDHRVDSIVLPVGKGELLCRRSST